MEAPPQRLDALDWLRGLMALSILLYHLSAFGYLNGPQDASTVLGKLGIYGVSIFFILSGLSIAIGYDKYIRDIPSSATFFLARLFRILPLLWLAIALVAIPAYLNGNPISSVLIGVNATTFFGFAFPHAYINTGAWSIGNEMVYYALTPLIIMAFHQSVVLGNIITAFTVLLGILFAFHFLTPNETLGSQWRIYINPFNNMFLYFSGIAIFYNFNNLRLDIRRYVFVFSVLVAILLLYPSNGDLITIVTGNNRVALSITCILIVLIVFKIPPKLVSNSSLPFKQLGLVSYGVYLLHPIITDNCEKYLNEFVVSNSYLFVPIVVVFTITASWLTFTFIEKPLMRQGKHLSRAIMKRYEDGKGVQLTPAQ